MTLINCCQHAIPLFLVALFCHEPVSADADWSISAEFPRGPEVEHAFSRNHRVAFSYSEWDDDDDEYKRLWRNAGVRYSYVMGDGPHYSEFALAVDFAFERVRMNDTGATFRGHEYRKSIYAGYRYEPIEGGFQFRTGLTHWDTFSNKDAYPDWGWFDTFTTPYLGIGWSF